MKVVASCAAQYGIKATAILHLASDCPLSGPHIVILAVRKFLNVSFGYFGKICAPSFPDGLNVGVLHAVALKYSHDNAKFIIERKHIAPYFVSQGKFKCGRVVNSRALPITRWMVNETWI